MNLMKQNEEAERTITFDPLVKAVETGFAKIKGTLNRGLKHCDFFRATAELKAELHAMLEEVHKVEKKEFSKNPENDIDILSLMM